VSEETTTTPARRHTLSDAYRGSLALLEMAINRPARAASEEVSLTRNAKGDVQISVAGTSHEGESLEETAARVAAVFDALAKTYPPPAPVAPK
jgi:hypothetical protein